MSHVKQSLLEIEISAAIALRFQSISQCETIESSQYVHFFRSVAV